MTGLTEKLKSADFIKFVNVYLRDYDIKSKSWSEIMKNKFCMMTTLLLFFTICGYGYIDPGTGSQIIQIIIAAFVGASLGIKIYWRRIKAFFVKSSPEKKDE